MKLLELTVSTPEGIHARPAADLVRLASTSGYSVKLGRVNEPAVAANSILSILGLGLKSGDRIRIEIDGPDSDVLARDIAELFGSK